MDQRTKRQLVSSFEAHFGAGGDLFYARAPGRVNLIGEHTDYNGGFVMPMAVDRDLSVIFRGVDEGPVRLWSEDYGESDEFDLQGIEKNDRQPWTNYPRGVALSLLRAGYRLVPIEGVICGDVPIGAGLSSSAALEVAVAVAFCFASSIEPDRKDLARLCQRAENEFVGVNCGVMDQFVSLHAESRHAVLIDCRCLTHRFLPLDTSRFRVLVCNTMVKHELGDSSYNERRASCEAAARVLSTQWAQVKQLRDVTPQMLEQCQDLLKGVAYRRARHVVTEDDRVLAGVDALEAGDYVTFGTLMNASHESLRVDYEVSCAELDLMVELARQTPGLLGARMTGAGFGGCTVNLVEQNAVESFEQHVGAHYRQRTGIVPEIYDFSAVIGASVERC